MCGEICTDGRFEIIEKAKQKLLDSTNIDKSPKEMEVLDNFLFRSWQMGWLREFETKETYEHSANRNKLKKELASLLNKHGMDNICETPDYILADYIEQCLLNYSTTVNRNITWHHWKKSGVEMLEEFESEVKK